MNTTQPLGWRWQTGERGYGAFAPRVPTWSDAPAKLRRVVIGHSLGPHLLAPQVLQRADAVVLLASFAAFIPEFEPPTEDGLGGDALVTQWPADSDIDASGWVFADDRVKNMVLAVIDQAREVGSRGQSLQRRAARRAQLFAVLD